MELTTAAMPILLDGGVESTLADAEGAWQYALVFALAAIPWFEILLVIPPAVALGLDPVAVAALAFLGNALPIYGIVAGHRRVRRRWRGGGDAGADEDEDDAPSRRRRWARRLWNRYGLPGLALAAPILTGVHLAAVIALGLRAPGRSVAVWMTVGIALWTVVLTAGSIAGLSLIGL